MKNNHSLIKHLYKITYGLGHWTVMQYFRRMEFNIINDSSQINPAQKLVFELLKTYYIFNNTSYKTKVCINIYLLNLLGTYKGWRHSRGLPVRGQRTWSNGWSSYRSNLVLRSYKITLTKKMYGHNFSNDHFTAYLAEEVNNMWKWQWGDEWKEAKKKRLNFQKNSKTALKVDLASMSKLQLGISGKKSESSKKVKKNTFTLGFDPGFTKSIVNATKKI